MKLLLFSINSHIEYKNINIINVFLKKNSFSIMNNYVSTIGYIDKISFIYKNKKIFLFLKDAFFINKKNLIKIVCDYYEFL